MAEIILAPTVQSKVIPLSLRLNDTDTSLVSQLVTNRQFNTADTDAWFGFTLEGLAATTGTFDLTLINLQDKSVFNHTDKMFNTNPFYYKLDSGTDELTNEIRHAGKWVGQLVVTLPNGDSATRKFIFAIEGHVLDGAVVQTVLLEDYNALISDIESAKDELTQYNIDYSTLISTVESQEAARVQAELTREQTFNALVDSEIIAQNVATELQNVEATYAPRLLSAEQQLAEAALKTEVSGVQTQVDNLVLGAVGDGNNAEVLQARADELLLNTRLANIESGERLLQKTVNIYDWKAIDKANYLNDSGVLTAGTTYYTSNFMKARTGDTVIIVHENTTFGFMQYDKDGAPLSVKWGAVGGFSQEAITITTPNVEFIRMRVSTTGYQSRYCYKTAVAPPSFVPYQETLPDTLKTKVTQQIKSDLLNVASVNKLNPNEWTSGKYLNIDGTITDDAAWALSPFIPIKNDGTYTAKMGNAAYAGCLFDADFDLLQAVYDDAHTGIGTLKTIIPLTTNNKAYVKYFRYSVPLNAVGYPYLNFFEGTYANFPSVFYPYVLELNGEKILEVAPQAYAQGDMSNVKLGEGALASGSLSKHAVAIGYNALKNNRHDAGIQDSGYYNTAVGTKAMELNTLGDHDTAVGYQALQNNTDGKYNTALGEDALLANVSGNENTAVGTRALQNNTNGNTTTALGVNSGYNQSTGANNVLLGYRAGYSLTTDTKCIMIGSWADKGTADILINAIGIGGAPVKSNETRLGTANCTVVDTYGDFEVLTNGRGLILRSPNGSKFKLTVSDAGSLTTTLVV